MNAPHRQLFGEFPAFLEVGRSAGMKAVPFSSIKDADLSEIILESTTYVSEPSILIDSNKTLGGLIFSPLAANRLSQIVKDRAPKRVNESTIPRFHGMASYVSEAKLN